MNEIIFKHSELEDIDTSNIDLVELYYEKFRSIYGDDLTELVSKLFSNEKKREIKKSLSENYHKAEDVVKKIRNREYVFITINLNGRVIGFARTAASNDYTIVPEVVFNPGLKKEEEHYFTKKLMDHLESTLTGKLFLEVPHKDEDLLFEMLQNDYELESLEESAKYNLNKAFLLSKDLYNRVLK